MRNQLYFRCKQCQKEVKYPQNRNAAHCSNACRQKAYRERKKKGGGL